MNISYRRRLSMMCLICVLFLSGCNSQPVKKSVPATPAPVLAVLHIASSPRKSIPAHYLGMNIELNHLCSILQTDAAHTKAYEHLYQNLGQGTLHVGGNSVDEASWSPDGYAACSAHPTITRAEVQSFFAFARRIHWSVIWGLNFVSNNPRMDADEASYVSSVGGHMLLGFTIGNEPELYARNGERPADWGYSNYIVEWEADRNAILAQVPAARFIGPEICCISSWFSSFVQDEGASGTLVAASIHHYAFSGEQGNVQGITPQSLLDPQTTQQFATEEQTLLSAARKEGLPVDISETNSVSNGGMIGVSNTFGAALWISDVLFQSAILGINQMDFQEVPDAAYALINTQGRAQIIYYGLLFFYQAAAHAVFLSSMLSSSANVSTYVLKGSDGTLRIVVINKEPGQAIAISVHPGAAYQKLETLRLRGHSLFATGGVTLGNTTLSANGAWVMPEQNSEPVQNGEAILNVPASSAALFTLSGN